MYGERKRFWEWWPRSIIYCVAGVRLQVTTEEKRDCSHYLPYQVFECVVSFFLFVCFIISLCLIRCMPTVCSRNRYTVLYCRLGEVCFWRWQNIGDASTYQARIREWVGVNTSSSFIGAISSLGRSFFFKSRTTTTPLFSRVHVGLKVNQTIDVIREEGTKKQHSTKLIL